jgi:UDP-N-acetylglucosamine--N-acetylmuramyl-(pentapeptide) pyrophosphoryl-undecaprenol N-acetylglucosamine transferase
MARRIAVTVAQSATYFPGRTVLDAGYPVRPELEALAAQGQAGQAAARQALGLHPQRPAVLVTGGSRGARSINRAVFAALTDWLEDYQVIHLSGQLDWTEAQQARQALPERLRAHYHAMPYLHDMGQALAAAHLVVSRAGASALGEYPLFGLPSILVPYPHAWRYQVVNADLLAARGAAVRLDDADLPARLQSEVRGLLSDQPRLQAMAAAARAAARSGAAARIAAEVIAAGSGAPP